jgi:CRP-like cAMP-binding protein
MNIEEIKKDAKLLKFSRGQKIYEDKSYLSDIKIFYILKGEVILRKKYTPLVKEEFHLKEGDWLGILELYTSKIRITEAEALTDVELLGFDKITFERILVSNIEISFKVIRMLSQILRKANERIKSLPE